MKNLLPGIILTTVLAVISYILTSIHFISSIHLSSMIIAILLGIIIGNIIDLPDTTKPGIVFSSKYILRLAIILLGFKLSIVDVIEIGSRGLGIVVVVTSLTLIFALWLGQKHNLNRNLSLLIGTGSAICGASAIAAMAPVVKAHEEDTTFAIGIVTLFGTISMLIFPVLYRLLRLPDFIYAVWAGSSIHEVAQVVAAGFAAGETAGQFATVVKLSRVLLIIPATILIGYIENKRQKHISQDTSSVIPWFVLGFLLTIIINSLNIIPQSGVTTLAWIDSILLTIAMAGMGLATKLKDMSKIGTKALYVGLFTSLFIAVIGFILSTLMYYVL